MWLLWVFFLWFLFYCLRQLLIHSACGQHLFDYFQRSGWSFSLFHVIFETNAFNLFFLESFNQHEKHKRRILSMWFDIGILVMFLGQILSLITLTVSLFYSLHSLFHFTFPSDHSSSSSPSPDSLSLPSGPLITPVIPGVNFPLKYLFDFWVCTFLVIVVHEFGHAAAASMERLQIQGCGFFFLFLFPGAYVRIEESIHYLPMYPQLRVYSAGVWHNIVMATICIITLLGLPHLLSIGYFSMEHSIPVVSDSLLHWNPPPSSEAQGVVITHMIPESPLTQSIKVGDILVSINDRSIQSTREFQRELTHLTHFIESSLLSQTEIDRLKSSNTSFHSLPSHSPGQYLPDYQSGYVVRGKGICASGSLLEDHELLSKQCCKQVFFPNTYRQVPEDWSSVLDPLDAAVNGDVDLSNTCYLLSRNHSLNLVSSSSSSSKGVQQETITSSFGVEDLSESGTPLLSTFWRSHIYCMPARDVQTPPNNSHSTHATSPTGDSNAPKASLRSRTKGRKCITHSDCLNKESHCIYPLTSYPTTLITLGLLSPFIPLSSSSVSATVYHYHEVLYEGTPHELIQTISIGSYRLRHWVNVLTDFTGIHDGYSSQSSLYLFFSQLPDMIILYLWLCIQLNLSVALLNMLPVSILDGGLTCPQFARLLFPKNWERLSKITEYYGMFLLGGNLLIGLIPLILSLLPSAAAGTNSAY